MNVKAQVIKFRRKTEAIVVSAKGKFKGEDLIEKGYETECILHPKVIEEKGKFIEVADLEMPGGETWVEVPYRNFEFVEA